MRAQRESRVTWCLAVAAIVVVFSLICFNDDLAKVGDSIFLYNRCFQMRDCLQNGLWPYIYYEDLGGIGYGSPIFYGQLTLLPFMPFLDDISVFLKVYSLACILLNFFGFRSFLKRISNYATLTSCFYVISMPFLALLGGNIPANAMAVGFSWLFFAYCIDFFRDGHCIHLVTLSYFLIWQSNFNSTVLATVVCAGIFCVYFDRSRLFEYGSLFYATFCILMFDILSMVMNWDSIALTDPEVMLSVINQEADCRVTSIHPIGGYLVRSNIDVMDCCCGFMTIGVFLVFLFFVIRGIRSQSLRFKVCTAIIGVVTVVGYAVGMCTVWPSVYKAMGLFFQFPIRYYILLFGFVLAILSRFIKPRWFVYLAVALCIVDVFAVNPFRSAPSSHIEYIGLQLGNGEYAGDDFVKDYGVYKEYSTKVHSESSTEYEFEREYNEVIVDCSANPGEDVLTLPKLYYKWYIAIGDDNQLFEVTPGYSNYCQVDIGDYTGSLTLTYAPPYYIVYLRYFQIGVFLVCLVGGVRSFIHMWERRPPKYRFETEEK